MDRDTAERIVKVTEIDLRTSLPTWRDRMVAAAAESFSDEDCVAVVTVAAELAESGARPNAPTVTLTAGMLAQLVADAQGNSPRAAMARAALLSIGEQADRADH